MMSQLTPNIGLKKPEITDNIKTKTIPELAENFDKIDAQLAGIQTQQTTNINNIANKVDKVAGKGLSTNDYDNTEKAEVAKVKNKADTTYVDTKVSQIVSGSPKGTYASLSALQTAFPSGTTGIYVTTDNGHWYYWNGSAWADGGVYQTTGLSVEGVNADKISSSKFNLTTADWELGTISSGANASNTTRIRTINYIKVSKGAVIKTSNSSYMFSVPYYDYNKTFLGTSPWLTADFVVPNDGYIRVVGKYATDAAISDISTVSNNISVYRGVSASDVDKLKDDVAALQVKNYVPDNSINWNQLNTMQPFIYPFPFSSLYIEIDATNNFAYLKADNIYVRNQPSSVSSSWATITGALASYVKTSPKGITSCIEIPEGGTFVYNTVSKAFEIATWNTMSARQIKLLQINNDEVTGLFADRYNLADLQKRVGTLEATPSGSNSSGVPSYWSSSLNNKISQIKAKQNEFGKNGFSFGFVTDMHYPTNYLKSPVLMAEILKRCDIKYFINGGDSHNQASTRDDAITSHRAVMNSFKDAGIISRMLMLQGNHDDNTQGSKGTLNVSVTMTPDITYSERFRYTEDVKNINASSNGLYYYVDDPVQKVRIILINSHDSDFVTDANGMVTDSGYITYAYKQEQINWFANVALNTPDSTWSVVIASHVPPTEENIVDSYLQAINTDIMVGIANAYKNKTTYTGSHTDANPSYSASTNVDFTGKGGDVIAWVCGHTHSDNLSSVGGIPVLNTTCDANDRLGINSSPRTAGTATEQAFDIITVNKATKTCYVTRIGAGNDRTFTY